MSGNPEFVINEVLYQRFVRIFSLLRRRLGINIEAHVEYGLIERGQIFLFNHFARFETIIPQYFIYQATGTFCRCVASRELFEGNERFAKLLRDCGAVPNNRPGLLAFLAAEILRGRKVIIFPEGAMNKDRLIAATKHRQGAAALAVILEIFKKRILSVFDAGDHQRLDRWVVALGLANQEALIAAARKPTLIVPSNITFYPIHTTDNMLRKAAEFFAPGIGERAKAELLIEGNLLFRNTDMDIRFGQPIHPDVAWNFADRLLLRQTFEQIDSLDELFGLKDTASRWVERMAAVTMRRTTRRLRDLCMAEMYARVTVNLSHLASRLVVDLLERGEIEIERSRFHRLLYRIVKDAQRLPNVHLHKALIGAEIYSGIQGADSPLLAQFFKTATQAALIEVTGSHYRLLPALSRGNGNSDPRLDNMIRVYANEIAALSTVNGIVKSAVSAELAVPADVQLDRALLARARYPSPRELLEYGWQEWLAPLTRGLEFTSQLTGNFILARVTTGASLAIQYGPVGASFLPRAGAAVSRVVAPLLRRFKPNAVPPPQPQPQPHPWEKSYPNDVDWHERIVPKSLTALLDEAVVAHAGRVCLSFRGKQYSYREVGQLAGKAAKGLQQLGVRRGIKVGLLMPNCPYAVICSYGVLKAGGTVVNINPLYSPVEIERQAADAEVRIIISLDIKLVYEKVEALVEKPDNIEKLVVCRMKGMLRFAEKLAHGLFRNGETATVREDESHILFDRLIDNDGAFEPVIIDPVTEAAVLQYTGGTTGCPKGAELTHANLYCNATQLARWAPQARPGREKTLAVLPLFHSFGMTAVMNLGLSIGAEIILLPRFSVAEVLATIDRQKPTVFIGVPTMFSALINHGAIAKYDLSSLRFCISGGAALSLAVQRRFEELTGCKLVEGYGLSEASPVCTINPLSGGKAGSAGLPLPQTVVEIVALDNPDRMLGPGERGEICVGGPQVMAGYANRARENVAAFRGTRLRTGDMGYLDEDGYLFIVDRIKDLILSSGFNVYPREVEEAIELHPAVAEAAVCGVADPHRGEIVKAFVRLHNGAKLTAAELREFCAGRLAQFKIPRKIEFRSTLPHTFLGKISKKALAVEALTANDPDPGSLDS